MFFPRSIIASCILTDILIILTCISARYGIIPNSDTAFVITRDD